MVEQQERLLGPYQLRREAGRGGMATVYEAVDTRDGRTVAVKMLSFASEQSPDERQKLLARLRREAHAISRLRHPNIVEMYDLVIAEDAARNENGTAYIVMEYVAGETLRERVRRTGPLSPAEAVPILEQVADALDAVHAAGIIHRDLKPSNIMLLPDGTAKLMDFGVARLQDDTKVTRTGMVVGSPAYMSPEQATGQPLTPLSDVWSLASVFFETLTGEQAFKGDNIPAVLYQVAFGKPTPLPQTSAEVEPIFSRFAPVFARAFAPDPADRFDSAREMAAAFRRALVGQDTADDMITVPFPDVRRSAITSDRIARLRRRWPAVAIPAALGVLVAGLYWPRARDAEATPLPGPTRTAATPVAVASPTPDAVTSPTPEPAVQSSASVITETTLTNTRTDSLASVSKPSPEPTVKPVAQATSKATPVIVSRPAALPTVVQKAPGPKPARKVAARPQPRAKARPAYSAPRPAHAATHRVPPGQAKKEKGGKRERGNGHGHGRERHNAASSVPFGGKTVLRPGG